MVGSPKTLFDLRKIDADLRIECRACGKVRMLDREWLITELMKRRKSVDWEAVQHQLRCSAKGCGSKSFRALPVPYSGRGPEIADAVLKAADAYVAAAAAEQEHDINSRHRATLARGELHQAVRRLVMWAKYEATNN